MLLGKNMKLQNILAAALVSIGAGLLFFTMPLHASEVANNDYKQRVVQGCQQYMNSNNPDLPAACLYGGLGDAGLQYFPHSAPSCQDRSDYKGEEKTACQRGAESGKNAFRDVFRNFVNAAYIARTDELCNGLGTDSETGKACREAARGGDNNNSFPHSPDVCTKLFAKNGPVLEACNKGVAEGNLLYEQFIAIGEQPGVKPSNTDGSGNNAGGNGGGNHLANNGASANGTGVNGQNFGNNAGFNFANVAGPNGTANGRNGSNGAANGGVNGDGGGLTGGTNGSSNGAAGGNGGNTRTDVNTPGNSGNRNNTSPTNADYIAKYGIENKGAGKNNPGPQDFTVNGNRTDGFYINGNGDRQAITITRPDNQSNRPAILFVNGGGWRADAGTWGPNRFINQDDPKGPLPRGYVAVNISYRLMPNGLYAIYNDIKNATEYVRNNAAKFGIDPNRMAMWGDSAGGSLTARMAASGRSGLAAAVTMSGPMNAFRDVTKSLPTLAIGIDHSTCIDTGFTRSFTLVNKYAGAALDPQGFLRDLQSKSPQEQFAFAQGVLGDASTILNDITSYDWQSELKSWGIDPEDVRDVTNSLPSAKNSLERIIKNYKNNPSSDKDSRNSTPQKIKEDLEMTSQSLDNAASKSTKVGSIQTAITNLAGTISANGGNEQVVGILQKVGEISGSIDEITKSFKADKGPGAGLRDIVKDMQGQKASNPSAFRSTKNSTYDKDSILPVAMTAASDEKQSKIANGIMAVDSFMQNNQANGELIGQMSNLLQGDKSLASIASGLTNIASSQIAKRVSNPRLKTLAGKLGQCMDNMIQLSPAIFADPNTPPMFMSNAQEETVVPPEDAYDMQNRLRQIGQRGEVMILPGPIHMGYDARAVDPAFNFLAPILQPRPVGGNGGGAATPVP